MVEVSSSGAIPPDDDPKSELNVLRREVRQLQATVRDSALQIASLQDDIMQLRQALAAAEAEVEEGVVRENNLRMQLEVQSVKREKIESTMAAAEALVSSLREMAVTETESTRGETISECDTDPEPTPSYNSLPFSTRKESGSLEDIHTAKLDQVLSNITEGQNIQTSPISEVATLESAVSPEAAPAVAHGEGEQRRGGEQEVTSETTGKTAPAPTERSPEVADMQPRLGARRPMSMVEGPSHSHSHPPTSPPPFSQKRHSMPYAPVRSPQATALSAEASNLLRSAFEPAATGGGHPNPAIRSAAGHSDSPLPTVVEKFAPPTSAFGVTVRRTLLPTNVAFTVSDAHSGEIYALAASRDGRWVASGGDDRTIRVYDRSGKPYAQVSDSARSVTSLGIHQEAGAQSSDSVVIFSGGSDGSVRAYIRHQRRRAKWNVGTVIPLHSQPVKRILLDEHAYGNGPSSLILTCSTDRGIRICDVESGAKPFDVTAPSAVLDVSSFTNGSGLIASGHKDGGIRLWASREGTMVLGAKVHGKGVVSVACLDDGRSVLSLGRDNVMRLTDVRMNIGLVKDMEGGVQTVSDWHRVAVNGRHVVCGSGKPASLCIWNVDTGKLVRRLPSHAPDADTDVLDMVARKLRNPGCVVMPLWTAAGHFICAHRARQVAFWACA